MAGRKKVVHADGDALAEPQGLTEEERQDVKDSIEESEALLAEVDSTTVEPELPALEAEAVVEESNGNSGHGAMTKIAKGFLSSHSTLLHLTIPDETTQEQCEDLLTCIGGARTASYWWLVDWMAFVGKWGDRYDLVAKHTGWSPERAENILIVGQQFDVSERIQGLTFAHYEAICQGGIDHRMRMKLLKKAAKEGASSRELRAWGIEYLRASGIETRKVVKARDVVKDPHAALDDQAATIRNQEANMEALQEELQRKQDEIEELRAAAAKAIRVVTDEEDEDEEQLVPTPTPLAGNLVDRLNAYLERNFPGAPPCVEYAISLLDELLKLREDQKSDGIIYLDNDDYECWLKLTEQWNSKRGTSLTISDMIGGIGRAKYEGSQE